MGLASVFDGYSLKYFFGLVPAAGVGTRMGAGKPKQHLLLWRRTLLERSVDALLADARVARVFVILAPDDPQAGELRLAARCESMPLGGATRAQTVLQGLQAVRSRLPADAWVLVHDAARPCLEAADLGALIDRADAGAAGALLATPLSDTLKRAEGTRVVGTTARAGLWRAQTPQCFALALLLQALERARGDAGITDEASAVERLGLQPELVPAAATNIKLTAPGDLALAEAILRAQGRW